jgi:hypothetical protein
VDSETKELVERLRPLLTKGASHPRGSSVPWACQDAYDVLDLITTQAAQIEELQATQLGMHDYVVQQAKRIEELVGALKARMYALRNGNLEDEGMADEMILTALSRVKQEGK